MYTDHDFYQSVLVEAVDCFGESTLAVILNVPAADLLRWAQGHGRPPSQILMQIIDLMWPGDHGTAVRSRSMT